MVQPVGSMLRHADDGCVPGQGRLYTGPWIVTGGSKKPAESVGAEAARVPPICDCGMSRSIRTSMDKGLTLSSKISSSSSNGCYDQQSPMDGQLMQGHQPAALLAGAVGTWHTPQASALPWHAAKLLA